MNEQKEMLEGSGWLSNLERPVDAHSQRKECKKNPLKSRTSFNGFQVGMEVHCIDCICRPPTMSWKEKKNIRSPQHWKWTKTKIKKRKKKNKEKKKEKKESLYSSRSPPPSSFHHRSKMTFQFYLKMMLSLAFLLITAGTGFYCSTASFLYILYAFQLETESQIRGEINGVPHKELVGFNLTRDS